MVLLRLVMLLGTAIAPTSASAQVGTPVRMDSLFAELHKVEQKRSLEGSSITNDTLLVRHLAAIAEAFHRKSIVDSAKYFARRTTDTARRLHDANPNSKPYRHILLSVLEQIAWIYVAYYPSDSTETLIEEMKSIAAQAPNADSVLLRVHNHVGGAYFSRGFYPQATYYWQQTQLYAERTRDSFRLSNVLNNLAHIPWAEKDYDKALAYFLKALPIAERLPNKSSFVLQLSNIGSVYAERNDSTKNDMALAMEYHLRALALARTHQMPHREAQALLHLAKTHLIRHNYRQALEYCLQSLAIRKRLKQWDYYLQAEIFVTLAASYQGLKNIAQAEDYAKQAVQAAEREGLKPLLRDAYRVLSEINAEQGDFSQAYLYQGKLMSIKDSLLNQEVLNRLNTLESEHALERKQQEINRLTQDNEHRRATQYRLAAAVAVLVLLLVAMFMLYRAKRRSESALQATNEEIRKQQGELAQQAKEIQLQNTLLAAKNLDLQTLHTEKDEVMGIATHDLKNPLANIMLSAELAERLTQKTLGLEARYAAKMAGYTASIIATSKQMLSIISNLLEMNKIERGALVVDVQNIDCMMIVQQSLNQHEQYAQSKAITLYADPINSEQPEQRVSADADALRQVIDNLLSNAIKYSPPQTSVGVLVLADHEHVCAYQRRAGLPERKDCCLILVQDQGPGINDNDKTKLFQKFSRLSAKPTGGERSTGLGLSIVKKLVEAMQGRVWCESVYGNGATFVVEMLLADENTNR
jgi:signal transduction histidine kinase